MAAIVLKFEDINGESTLSGHTGQVDAISIRESISVSASQSSGGSASARTVGTSRHSDICVTRFKDIASPKLAQACSAGTNLKTVEVYLFRTLETGVKEYMRYVLSETFVSRYENDTADQEGAVFGPSLAASEGASPLWGVAGLMGPIARRSALNLAPAPLLLAGVPRGQPTTREVERVWFNPSKVSWTYTPYVSGAAQGVVQREWNLLSTSETED